MSRINDISSSPTMRAFAQGAAQAAIQPVAEFLAPTVEVATMTGRYKQYTEKNRFRIPDTARGLGGRATVLAFDAADALYNCSPQALDYPVDNLEQLEAEGLENTLKEGATAVAEVAALSHEKNVIDAALTAVGAGTGKVWGTGADPVDDIDGAILDVVKAAKYGSLMGVGILMGVGAWRIFKNHSAVRARFVVGSGKNSGVGFAVPTDKLASDLFLGSPEVRCSYMVYDAAPEGKAASMSFLLDTSILVFARKAQPTRRDPSFMKTFRLMNAYMKPGSYSREDGRVEVAKFDWCEYIAVTNASAAVRYNITTTEPQE